MIKENDIINYYDVVIAGAGPAGLSAAIMLQKKGVKCLVIDKNVFPRDKLCGGLLTKKAYDSLLSILDGKSERVDSAIKSIISSVGIQYDFQLLNKSETTIPIRIVDRSILDYNMLDYYKKIGGIIKENETYLHYNDINKTVTTNKRIYYSKFFINATGAITKSKNKYIGFCLETFVDKNDIFLDDETIMIDFGIIDNGYAWIFPAGNYYKIGFGNKYNKEFNYREKFIEYLNKLGVKDVNKTQIKGAFVPYGKCEKKHVIDNFCILLGDQAGMVDPLYGEGLFFTITTGIELANSIDRNINGTGSILDYERSIKKYKNQVNAGNILKAIFFSNLFQKLFRNIIRKSKKLIKFYVDEQVSQYKYYHLNILGQMIGYAKSK